MSAERETLLLPVRRDVRGIDIENHFPRRGLVLGDEMLGQHTP